MRMGGGYGNPQRQLLMPQTLERLFPVKLRRSTSGKEGSVRTMRRSTRRGTRNIRGTRNMRGTRNLRSEECEEEHKEHEEEHKECEEDHKECEEECKEHE